MIGSMPYLIIIIFFINAFLPRSFWYAVIAANLIAFATFIATVIFLKFDKSSKYASMVGLLLGSFSIYVSESAGGLAEVFLEHGGIILLSQSSLLAGHKILRQSGYSERINLLTAAFCLIALIAGPVLFGMPILYFLNYDLVKSLPR